jgi:N-acetylmuramoyl-L-alanine amidase
MMPITHGVVHYSATYDDQHPPITAADIDRMHKARGWKGIGYHWVIRADGTVEPGRPETEQGAHVGGQNRGKLGVCYAGGLRRSTGPGLGVNTLNPAQEAALIGILTRWEKDYPGIEIVGHKDLAATQCPGFDVPVWWTQVKARRASTKGSIWTAILRFFGRT